MRSRRIAKFMMAGVLGGSAPLADNMLRWRLDDNLADTVVVGDDINAVLVGGNTADVHATVGANSAFHLDGSSQYIRIDIPTTFPSARENLWTKYASNPVLADSSNFGQLCANPAGGWYLFAARANNTVCRWSSTDLITWTDRISILALGTAGNWDDTQINVASAFQKPDDTWVLFYRGANAAAAYKIGMATSADGTTFTKKDNGGVNDGLTTWFGNNYDPVGVILVGSTYYIYVNGDPNHGSTNIYHSDDLSAWTEDTGILFSSFGTNEFCPTVWKYGSYYYALVCRSGSNESDNSLYKHGLCLYKSDSPAFPKGSTSFLGYAAVNDQAYDTTILDTPSIPTTDVYRTTYAPEFGDNLHTIYAGASINSQALATTSLAGLSSLIPRLDHEFQTEHSFSFNVQFDTLTAGDAVLSMGDTASEGSPRWLLVIKTAGADKVLSLFLGGYQNTNIPLVVNTPYHIAVVENTVNRKVYVNGSLGGTFTQNNATNSKRSKFYLGAGFNGEFLDGYVWDLRIYPYALSQTEVTNLYTRGTVV